jgi:hypothetical protein
MQEQPATLKEIIQAAFDSLEEAGLMRKTGQFSRDEDGDLQPWYTATTVSKWLNETGLSKQFDEYLESKASQDGHFD